MPVEVTSSSRKRRRKEERQKKKQKRGQAAAHTHIEEEINDGKNDTAALAAAMDDPLSKTTTTTTKKKSKQLRNDDDDDTTKRQKKKNRHTNTTTNVDKYSKFDSVTAAALRADDDEIAALEAKLGLDRSKKGKNGKSKLNKEYAKLEGYGDDFGDFLDDLDDLVDRVVDGDDEEEGDYEGLEDGFSDDEVEEEMDVDEDGNELIPMKPGADDDELDDSSIDDNIEDDDDDDGGGVESDNESLSSSSSSSSDVMADNNDGEIDNTTNPNDNKNNNADDSDSDTSSSSSTSDSETAAISENDTYRPSSGEDIYGNQITNNDPSPPVAKYTPPHARLSSSSSSSPNLSILSKNINSQFNRLSDNNLEPVSKSIASLYQSSSSSSDDQQQQYATNDVNHCLYSCLKKSLIRYDIIVDKLIPLYTAVIAAAAGKSDLVGYVLEQCVLEFIKDNRTKRREEEEEEEMEEVSKEGLNHLLIICYLYNYDVVYCGLIYDIIRYLYSDRNNSSSSSDDDDGGDDELSEHDVEALLLIVQHCGFRLRKDDPSSLKDIVMAVQEKAATAMATTTAKSDSSSRFQYMIDTMTSLKHNKKTIKDKDQEERIMRYKKFVRRMSGDNGGNCLRIGLDDIMNINTKGRWWKVGASWKGNIYRGDDDDDDEENDDETHDTNDDDTTTTKPSSSSSQQQQHPSSSLLTLATANQIHDSTRQSLFCIIMSSADVDDAFEKLVRYVKDDKSAERLVIRVVLDCCAKERNYNPYYSHLACRLCEFFEKRCKWSLRLAFWDVFKRWSEEEEDGDGDDGIDEERRSQRQREVVNMSKMLIHFVKKGTLTTRGVLKGMDDLKFDARSMPELGVLFMVAFCDGIFDWDGMESRQVGDVLFGAGLSKDSDVQRKAVKKRKGKKKHGKMEDGEGDDNDEALRESLGVFLKLHMEKSPKNVKGTRWSKNFKAAMKACDLNSLDMI